MKKILIMASLPLMIATVTSCKKDVTCECTTTSTTDGVVGKPSTTTTTYKKVKKKDVAILCGDQKYSGTWSSTFSGGTSSGTSSSETKCVIK